MEDAERALLRVVIGLVALSLIRRSIVPSAWGRSSALDDGGDGGNRLALTVRLALPVTACVRDERARIDHQTRDVVVGVGQSIHWTDLVMV